MQSFQGAELDSDSLIGAFHSESKKCGKDNEAIKSLLQRSRTPFPLTDREMRSATAIDFSLDRVVCRHPQEASAVDQTMGAALARHKKTLRPFAA